MRIEFFCPSCGEKLGVPEEEKGKEIRCPYCNENALIPTGKEGQDSTEASEMKETKSQMTPGTLLCIWLLRFFALFALLLILSGHFGTILKTEGYS